MTKPPGLRINTQLQIIREEICIRSPRSAGIHPPLSASDLLFSSLPNLAGQSCPLADSWTRRLTEDKLISDRQLWNTINPAEDDMTWILTESTNPKTCACRRVASFRNFVAVAFLTSAKSGQLSLLPDPHMIWLLHSLLVEGCRKGHHQLTIYGSPITPVTVTELYSAIQEEIATPECQDRNQAMLILNAEFEYCRRNQQTLCILNQSTLIEALHPLHPFSETSSYTQLSVPTDVDRVVQRYFRYLKVQMQDRERNRKRRIRRLAPSPKLLTRRVNSDLDRKSIEPAITLIDSSQML